MAATCSFPELLKASLLRGSRSFSGPCRVTATSSLVLGSGSGLGSFAALPVLSLPLSFLSMPYVLWGAVAGQWEGTVYNLLGRMASGLEFFFFKKGLLFPPSTFAETQNPPYVWYNSAFLALCLTIPDSSEWKLCIHAYTFIYISKSITVFSMKL